MSVITADVNFDGKKDLISVNINDNTLTVLTNSGSGIFTASSTNAVGTDPFSVVAANLNGNDKLDLVCVNSGDDTLLILTNSGNGAFGSNSTYTVGNYPLSVVAADVNGDNKLDLVSANQNSDSLTVLTNRGNGPFMFSSTVPVGRLPNFVAQADLNGDGKIDLVSVNWFGKSLTILTNNGFGDFGSNTTCTLSDSPVCVVAADVNGDNKLDLISANEDNTLSVLTNDGGGRFTLASSILTGVDFWPQSVIATDINEDGKTDLIFINFNDFYTPGTLTILTNNGASAFTISSSHDVGDGPYCVLATDVNGDGKLDLITADHLDNTLSILINVPKLFVKHIGDSVNVSWPSSWTNWTLQQNLDGGTTNWSTSGSISDDGTNKGLTVQPSTGKLLFRLSHP